MGARDVKRASKSGQTFFRSKVTSKFVRFSFHFDRRLTIELTSPRTTHTKKQKSNIPTTKIYNWNFVATILVEIRTRHRPDLCGKPLVSVTSCAETRQALRETDPQVNEGIEPEPQVSTTAGAEARQVPIAAPAEARSSCIVHRPHAEAQASSARSGKPHLRRPMRPGGCFPVPAPSKPEAYRSAPSFIPRSPLRKSPS